MKYIKNLTQYKKILSLFLTFVICLSAYGCAFFQDDEISEVEETIGKEFNTIYGNYEVNTKIKHKDIDEIIFNAGGRLFEKETITLSDGTKVMTKNYLFSVENLWVAFFDSAESSEKYYEDIYKYISEFIPPKSLYTGHNSAVKIGNILCVGGYNTITLLLKSYISGFVLSENKFTEPNCVKKYDFHINVADISSYMEKSGYSEYKSIDYSINNIWWGFVNFSENELCILIELSDAKTEKFANLLLSSNEGITKGICYGYTENYVLISRVGVWDNILNNYQNEGEDEV